MTVEAEVERAMKAASRASRWHQGSGTQADMAASMAEQHADFVEEGGPDAVKHLEAARLWADVAEADADYLDGTKGSSFRLNKTLWVPGPSLWENDEAWRAAIGPAVEMAIKASGALGMDVSDWNP